MVIVELVSAGPGAMACQGGRPDIHRPLEHPHQESASPESRAKREAFLASWMVTVLSGRSLVFRRDRKSA